MYKDSEAEYQSDYQVRRAVLPAPRWTGGGDLSLASASATSRRTVSPLASVSSLARRCWFGHLLCTVSSQLSASLLIQFRLQCCIQGNLVTRLGELDTARLVKQLVLFPSYVSLYPFSSFPLFSLLLASPPPLMCHVFTLHSYSGVVRGEVALAHGRQINIQFTHNLHS